MHPRTPFLLISCLAALTAHAVPQQSPAPSASAPQPNPLIVTCVGSSAFTFTPGLKNTPQNITQHTTIKLTHCAFIPLRPTTTATLDKTQVFPGHTCTDLLKPLAPTQATFTWGDGGSSKMTLSQTRVEGQGATTVLVGVGSVTDGKYKGATAVRTLTYVQADVTQGCLSPQGLTQTSGPATLTLTLPQ
jgi:hypothetical protein